MTNVCEGIVAVRSDVARNWGCHIAVDLVPAQTMLLEPAMQHIGIHAMFTRRGGNRCTWLQACGDQLGLELRAVDPTRARDGIARWGSLLRHGVHDDLRGHDGAWKSSVRVDGITGRIRCLRNWAARVSVPMRCGCRAICSNWSTTRRLGGHGPTGKPTGMTRLCPNRSATKNSCGVLMWSGCQAFAWHPDSPLFIPEYLHRLAALGPKAAAQECPAMGQGARDSPSKSPKPPVQLTPPQPDGHRALQLTSD